MHIKNKKFMIPMHFFIQIIKNGLLINIYIK
jgi:hypothetical protein